MTDSLTSQVIALAGLSQALFLVDQVARKGYADREVMSASIESTLMVDADDVLDVYGGVSNIKTGLKQLDRQLSSPDKVDAVLARYASTLIFLERQLINEPSLLDIISVALRNAKLKADSTQVLDHEVIEILADAYQRTISTLKPRVMVTGESIYLADPENAQLIRALLLAGVRSAVLWRQCGGRRWKFLLFRSKLQGITRKLLASV